MTREEREDAIDIIQSILDKYEEDECLVTEITIGDGDITAFKMAIKSLEQEPRKGMRWIGRFETHEWGKEEWCECPWCHMDSAEAYNFCPNCGADMREVEV